jgi:hypothetical protein
MLSRYNSWSLDLKKQDTNNETKPESTGNDEAQETLPKTMANQPEGSQLTAMVLTSSQAPASIQYSSPTLKGPTGAPYSDLAQAISTERTVCTITMSPSIEEGISNSGIQGHVLQRMSTQQRLQDSKISLIDQAETSRQANNHDEINWLLAKFPLDETAANITSVLELIAVPIKLHHLRAIIICINTTNSAKMHPIKHHI